MNINQDNISEINIDNYTNLNNQFYTVEWIIDTRPNYNFSENIPFTYHISNQNNQTESVINNDIPFVIGDDFIPFVQHISIDTEVCEIPVSDEERNCCICYETKECKDISQINCGHKFCGTCIIDHISINHLNPCCPLCRVKINHITFQRDFYQRDFEDL